MGKSSDNGIVHSSNGNIPLKEVQKNVLIHYFKNIMLHSLCNVIAVQRDPTLKLTNYTIHA